MIFEINGFDVTPWLEEGKANWTVHGVDGPDAGRSTLNGDMDRNLLCYKAEGTFSCVWMPKDIALQLHAAIMPEFVTVRTDTIPWLRGTVARQMYSNNISSNIVQEYTDGTIEYGDLTFPLVEQ